MTTEYFREILSTTVIQKNKNLYNKLGRRNNKFDYGNVHIDPSYIENVLQSFVLKLPLNPKILDVGCGIGEEADELEELGAKTVRLDISKLALSTQKSENRIQASSWHLPFKNKSFNAVHCKDSYSHIPNELRSNFFSELERVIKPKGKILIVSTDYSYGPEYQYPTTLLELELAASFCGLSIMSCKKWVTGNHENDWYQLCKEKQPRYVVTLKKSAP